MSKTTRKEKKEWLYQELMDLVRKLGEENAEALLRDEVKVKFSKNIESNFTAIPEQISRWYKWLPRLRQEHSVTISEAQFKTFIAGNAVPFCPDKRLTTVVLTLRAPTAAQEFKLYWPLIAAQFESFGEPPDEHHFRWYAGSQNKAKDWHFEWSAIDLAAYYGTTVSALRKVFRNVLPSAHILAAAALNPQWVKMMNGRDIPYVVMPGYKVDLESDREVTFFFGNVPALCFDPDSHCVRLAIKCPRVIESHYRIPIFVREE